MGLELAEHIQVLENVRIKTIRSWEVCQNSPCLQNVHREIHAVLLLSPLVLAEIKVQIQLQLHPLSLYLHQFLWRLHLIMQEMIPGLRTSAYLVTLQSEKSIESPSTWKSPWFINSFLPGPRIDTEITIEDIGYFMSPGEKRLDALGLMKQLDEHTASAYADALEVLVLKGIQSDNSNLDLMMECHVLDFSECETP